MPSGDPTFFTLTGDGKYSFSFSAYADVSIKAFGDPGGAPGSPTPPEYTTLELTPDSAMLHWYPGGAGRPAVQDFPLMVGGARQYAMPSDIKVFRGGGTGTTVHVHGPFTADSAAAMASGAEAVTNVNHNLGLTGTQVALGMLSDNLTGGAWSDQFGWRENGLTGNTASIMFNNHGPNVGRTRLWFVILEFI